LPGFSKETLDEAFQDLFSKQETPSVRFALSCLESPLRSVKTPIAPKRKLGHLTVQEAINSIQKSPIRRVDFNRMWTLSQALEFAKAFKSTDFEYLEEPVRTWEELIEFSKQTSFPIALDESIHNKWEEITSLVAIVVKPTIVGYIPNVPKHLKLILSSSYESGIGLLHLARLAENLPHPAGLDTYSLLQEDLLASPIQNVHSLLSWQSSENPIRLDKLCPIAL
jgi:O-succinylbenzoate synthase